MEIIQQRTTTTSPSLRGQSLADRIKQLEDRKRLEDRVKDTDSKKKQFKWPGKWRSKFRKKSPDEKMLVIFLNKKNEIEPPKFMPIYDGNMIIWRNKPYEFDPRAVWRVKGMRKVPQVYLIKEIDRRPVRNKYGRVVYRDAAVSNMDLDEVRLRGDSTESDEFLIKAALKAQTGQAKKAANWLIIGIIVIVLIGVGIWFFTSGNSAPVQAVAPVTPTP